MCDSLFLSLCPISMNTGVSNSPFRCSSEEAESVVKSVSPLDFLIHLISLKIVTQQSLMWFPQTCDSGPEDPVPSSGECFWNLIKLMSIPAMFLFQILHEWFFFFFPSWQMVLLWIVRFQTLTHDETWRSRDSSRLHYGFLLDLLTSIANTALKTNDTRLSCLLSLFYTNLC